MEKVEFEELSTINFKNAFDEIYHMLYENGECEIVIISKDKGFLAVEDRENLSEPGVIFNYAQYVRMLNSNINVYKDIFFQNISQ